MLKAKPVWFSLDVFKADPGGYNAAHAAPVLLARALERAFTGRAVTGEYIPSRAPYIRYTRERDRIAARAILRQTRDLSKLEDSKRGGRVLLPPLQYSTFLSDYVNSLYINTGT